MKTEQSVRADELAAARKALRDIRFVLPMVEEGRSADAWVGHGILERLLDRLAAHPADSEGAGLDVELHGTIFNAIGGSRQTVTIEVDGLTNETIVDVPMGVPATLRYAALAATPSSSPPETAEP